MLITTEIRRHIKRHDTFAAWAMPGENEMHSLGEGQRFVINQFGETSDYNNYIEWSAQGDERTRQGASLQQGCSPARSTTKAQYLKGVRAVIKQLKTNGGKTVISRVISGSTRRLNVPGLAEEYLSGLPNTFRFLYNHPITGLWIVASPELLMYLDKTTGYLGTGALAGTRRRTLHDEPWDDKNLREHQVVRDYILTALRVLDLHPQAEPTGALPFGSIEHLATPINATINDQVTFYDILDRLSPTPALCGYPREKALQIIRNIELHNRCCYGGYIALETPKHILACVNLRCINIVDGRYNIFVGGGIMPDSDPLTEWRETCDKASRLTDIIYRMKHGQAR